MYADTVILLHAREQAGALGFWVAL